MSAINFTGLASGLDTDSIIKSLMEAEKQPLSRLEGDKEYFSRRLEAYKAFDQKLAALNATVDALDLNSDLRESQVSLSGENVVSASVTSAPEGSYDLAVEQLAQVQKSVSDSAYASRTEHVFGTGELTLTVGDGVVSEGAAGTDHAITIDENNNSLSGIQNAINKGTQEHGISATIIDNGNEGGDRYHLMLTGADSSTEFTLTSGLSGGTETISLDPPTQSAQDAIAYLDGVQLNSDTNTIKNALNGVTLNLEGVSADDGSGGLLSTTMTISTNTDSVAEKMNAFVEAYNDTVSFVTGQSKTEESDSGILAGDSGLNGVKRRLQGLLTTQVGGNDAYSALSQLGLSTNRDGTISFDATAFSGALESDFEEVSRVIAGDDDVGGVFKQYRSYLNAMTSSRNGFYATKQDNIERTIDRIDDDIVKMEDRLERREQMYLDKFTALEQMVAVMNSQSEYLTQQMDKMPSLGGGD
ncbi:flagellar hook-associated protein 2 [Desulfosalsimonas propionicica]|uniref:Flagellar hook-associated protein 2 n=1 Tax=Desulfosalsimonas propionicica TaxID=332175 RepID=A0A7W0HLU1_9BACT|nr:flagellar filament capping protein FliD [Desulfosalsimonas propionicica]MBA2882665.1 flagellar hook-associated protein 2 [Desulfosalsimonas propionicica]